MRKKIYHRDKSLAARKSFHLANSSTSRMKILQFLGLLLLAQFGVSEYTIACPKAFRVGAPQTVVLNLHGYQSASVLAFLQTTDLESSFSEVNVQVSTADGSINRPIDLNMMIQQEIGHQDIPLFVQNQPQMINLIIQVTNSQPASGNFNKMIPILVTKESGYIFVITSQPVYKPGEKVLIQAFTMDQAMRAAEIPTKFVIRVPPDQTGVSTRNTVMRKGRSFAESVYKIPTNPVFGKWIVEVSYEFEGYNTKAQTEFLVQRFVLPTFQVSITPGQNYVLVTDEEIAGSVKAVYSYGEVVDGKVYIEMKLKKTPNSAEISFFKFPGARLSGSLDDNGERSYDSLIQDLQDVLQPGETLSSLADQGAYIIIEATVRESSSGILESAVSHNIPILHTPYIIDTNRTSIYYNPRIAYRLKGDIFDRIRKEPAGRVNFEVLVNNVIWRNRNYTTQNGLIDVQIDLQGSGDQNIVIRAYGGGVTTSTFTLFPYQSANNKYLQIRANKESAYEIDEDIRITFSMDPNNNVDEIRYLILSRGAVVHTGRNQHVRGNRESSAPIRVTHKMAPSARIVAYYIFNNEVVSNSLWFDVVDQCKTPPVLHLAEQVFPKQSIRIRVEGAPESLVSINAVDRAAYFIYNGSRLTPKTMFDKMESYDQGCIRNGGRNSANVFEEAGLSLHTAQLNPAPVTALGCDDGNRSKKRKRRQADVDESDPVLTLDEKLEGCEKDGRKKSPNGDTCDVRASRVEDLMDSAVPGCSDRFLRGCETEREREIDSISIILGRTINDDNLAANLDASVRNARKNFNPNMIFKTIKLVKQNARDDHGEHTFNVPSSHSISTFEISAAMLGAEEDGFCVAPTKNIRIFQKIFIQVTIPYALKIQEQSNIRIAVFNYDDEPNPVSLYVKVDDPDTLCTRYGSDPERFYRLVGFPSIPPSKSAATVMTVLPVRIPENTGTTLIHFKAVNPYNSVEYDVITKEILIEQAGTVEDVPSRSFAIDLSNRNNERRYEIDLQFPTEIVPESGKCWLYAYSSFMGPNIQVDEVTDEPKNIARYFRQPLGCGEQNMIYTAPMVYGLSYLVNSGNVAEDSATYAKALGHIESGYARELTYKSELVQGPFAVFPRYTPSTWLNAFVDKVFVKAKAFVTELDLDPICESLEWLLTQQTNDGSFREQQKPLHREMHGAVGGPLTLTSYVAVSLLETQARCSSDLNSRISAAVENAMAYLINNRNSPTFSRPYALALFSYALALHQPTSSVTGSIFTRLHEARMSQNGQTHWEGVSAQRLHQTAIHAYWYNRRPLAVHIEATAYALLAIIKKAQNPPSQQTVDLTREIVVWLIEQQNNVGSFISTQDTVIALQALSSYETWTETLGSGRRANNFTISFSAPNLQWNHPDLRLTESDIRLRKTIEVPANVTRGGQVIATARGTGEGTISYRCIYRTLVNEESCDFNITDPQVEFLNRDAHEQILAGEAKRKIRLTFSVSKSGDATEMAIIEVGLMSGFVPDETSIFDLSTENVVDGIIDRYEITNVSVVLYVRDISPTPRVISFTMQQIIFVMRPEPARIKVYYYNEPSVQCSKFYSMDEDPHLLTSDCGSNNNEGVCRCAEGGCMKCRTRAMQTSKTICVSQGARDDCGSCPDRSPLCENIFNKACDNNYAYAVTVTSVTPPVLGNVFYSFQARVDEVLRTGEVENVGQGNTTTFYVRKDCFERCQDPILRPARTSQNEFSNVIRPRRKLFIMGQAPERFRKDNREVIKYYLNGDAVVERIIPKRRCRRLRNENCAKDQINPSGKCARKHGCEAYVQLRREITAGCDV